MRSLWSGSLLLLSVLLAGCVSLKPDGAIRESEQAATLEIGGSSDTTSRSAYVPPQKSHLFKAALDIKKHHLTGMLVIKHMTPHDAISNNVKDSTAVYRVVFVNEIGITFFDIELHPDSFRVISCFPSLDKKALFRILETNFRMLLTLENHWKTTTYRQEKTNRKVISWKSGRYRIWQTWSPSGDTLCQTSAKSSFADPVRIGFTNYKDGQPGTIVMENPVVGMKLALRRL